MNKGLTLKDYRDALKSFLHMSPQVALTVKLGPNMVKDIRSITAEAFRCAKPLLDELVTKGLSTGVMQTWKLAEATRDILMQEQKWLGTNEILEETISVTTKHIQTMFAFIREAKYEEVVHPGSKYMRTGGIRKRLAMAGYSDLLQDTLGNLQSQTSTSRSSSPASTILYAEEGRSGLAASVLRSSRRRRWASMRSGLAASVLIPSS